MGQGKAEKRSHPRINARFVVSYRILNQGEVLDITQTKNLSLGGMLLTTNRKFDEGIRLSLDIKVPFDPRPVVIVGRVVGSTEIVKDLIYDTRIEFLSIEDKHHKPLQDTVNYYLKKG